MAHRTGSADLPLHGGRVPAWLGARMSRLGAVISQAIVHHYGRDELPVRTRMPDIPLSRLTDPRASAELGIY